MTEASTIVEIVLPENKLNVPEESFCGNVKTEPKKKWFSFKKEDKNDDNSVIVHEIVMKLSRNKIIFNFIRKKWPELYNTTTKKIFDSPIFFTFW